MNWTNKAKIAVCALGALPIAFGILVLISYINNSSSVSDGNIFLPITLLLVSVASSFFIIYFLKFINKSSKAIKTRISHDANNNLLTNELANASAITTNTSESRYFYINENGKSGKFISIISGILLFLMGLFILSVTKSIPYDINNYENFYLFLILGVIFTISGLILTIKYLKKPKS